MADLDNGMNISSSYYTKLFRRLTHPCTDGQGAGHAPAGSIQPSSVPVTPQDTEQSYAPLSAVSIDMVRHEDSNSYPSYPENQTSASSTFSEDSPLEHKASVKADERTASHDEKKASLEEAPLTKPEDTLNHMDQRHSVEPNNHHNLLPEPPPSFGAVPMPPIPDDTPKASVSGRRLTWMEALQQNASLLGPHGLYRAFLARRNPYPALRAPAVPVLLRAVAEYLGETEDKLNTLQNSLQLNSVPPLGMRDPTHNQAGDDPLPVDDPLGKVVMETRFYHCEDGFDFWTGNSGLPATTRAIADRNHYTSSSDPAYFIRALFQWKEMGTSHEQTLDTGDIPDPKDINLLTFMVSSRPLAVFFEKKLGLRPSTVSVPVLKLGKPFRSVICNHSHLKKQLELLMAKYGSDRVEHGDLQEQPKDCQPFSEQVASTADANSDDDELEIFDQQSALDHFRLLVQFIDRYLGEKIALFEAFQDGQGEKVAYEDLWMLFSNGEKIFCPLRETRVVISSGDSNSGSDTDDDEQDDGHLTKRRYVPQAYRVMAAVGGGPLDSSFAQQTVDVSGDKLNDDPFLQLLFGRSSAFRAQTKAPGMQRAKERFSSLQVVCMYIDFDGVKYGMDTEIFAFKPFDGQIPIRSLEAYPLQYFVNPCSNYLVRRGQKFIDITALPRYMDHAGMTIGETREEVRFLILLLIDL